MKTAEDYTKMQVQQYDLSASRMQLSPGVVTHDEVVGSFQWHDGWKDHHEYLITHSRMGETKGLIALDFACGPGRNIRLYKDRFARIDGVDLSANNLANAKIYTSDLPNPPVLYHCNGTDLRDIPSDSYDIIISTIALQHICCYSIRYKYLQEFARVLKKGGFLCVQMGFGNPYPHDTRSLDYYSNYYDASGTNGYYDTQVNDPNQLQKDLVEVGFENFEYTIRPAGPGDMNHPNWIYWSAIKA